MMRRHGFTVVEVLVVISVISLLTAIFLPCLSRSKQQGLAVVCLSNLRQMVIAADIYATDNQSFYPLAGVIDFSNLSRQREWDYFKVFENGSLKECKGGFLWQGKSAPEIHQCPVFRGSSNSAGDPYTGYNYNASYIGGFITKVNGIKLGKDSSKITSVRKPSRCAIFGDGEFTLGANKYMRSPSAGKLDKDFGNSYRYAGTQGYRHLGKTNIGYCDGSVRAVRELYTETKSKKIIEEYNRDNKNKVGFLSPDNRAYDIGW